MISSSVGVHGEVARCFGNCNESGLRRTVGCTAEDNGDDGAASLLHILRVGNMIEATDCCCNGKMSRTQLTLH